MGEVVSQMDWSRTPLGPMERWPQSLRTTVSLALSSNFPISIAWGPRRVQIYNDGYWPICGAKHPDSMGQDFKECWFSAWPVIGEAFESAAAGQTAFLENQRMFLDRYGYLEETFFTFSFSPIRDETGRVAGLFHPVTEMTAQSVGERRLGVLREIAEESTEAASVDEAMAQVVRTLERHQLDVPFCLFYQLQGEAGPARLVAAANLPAGSTAAPREIGRERDDGDGWPLGRATNGDRPVVLTDLKERFGALECGPYPESPHTAALLPIVFAGMARPLGVLIVGASPRLRFDDHYRTFFRMLRETVCNAIGNARSYEEEKRRAEALAEIDRAKTTFFSNVSHEFRTPLTLMLGPLESSLAQPGLPEAQREPIALAHRNALRLHKLVNSLLDFSRIEAGRVQASYEATDLGPFTAELASNFRSACERAGLALRVHCPGSPQPIHVDRDMWEKIVLNLLSNAFKFTFAGEIEVRLEARADAAVLTVRDTGVGIPAAELPRLFERFHRVEGTRGRTHEGSGIGLALVQELVRLHGGAIEVASEPGRGTTMTVRVPAGTAHLPADRIGAARSLASTATGAAPFVEEALRWLPDAQEGRVEEKEDDAAPPVAADDHADRAEVLFVDDNADMRAYVASLLQGRYRVSTAADGEAALARVRQRLPDLVVSDVMMPGLDGFGLLRALRDDPRTTSVPIVLLSARAGEEARVEGLDAGADDYLMKPFSARELIARVDGQLRLSRLRRDTELRLREFVDAAPGILWVADEGNRCTLLSRGWTEYTGMALADALGDGWLQAVHPDDRRRVHSHFLAAAGRCEPFAIDFRLRRVDGGHGWVTGAGRPHHDRQGIWRGYIGSVVDVTDRRRQEEDLRAQSRRLRLLWEAAGVILSADEPVSMLHRLFQRIQEQIDVDFYFNYMVDEAGTALRMMSCAGIDDAEAKRISRLEFGQAVCGTVARERRPIVAEHIQDSDEPMVQLVRGYGIRAYACNPLVAGGRLLGTLSFATTRADAFRPEDLEFFETISRYVTAAYRQMQLIAELREADRRKDQFLATLAHEVRNPLAPLRTALEVLRIGDPSPTEMAATREVMERQVHQLTRLVDDLLDVSRITRGRLRLRRCRIALTEVVQRALEAIQPVIEQSDHRLEVVLPGEPVWLHADPLRLVQVLSNLLSNAAKYTPEGGHIELAAELQDDGVVVAVTDDGIGIEPEHRDLIFEMFAQIDRSMETGFKGLGIGLTLVKSLVDLHGGRVEVDSAGAGKGSCFRVWLPLAHGEVADPAPSLESDPAAGDTPRHRVLVVEDNRDAALTLTQLLRVLGHEVHVAFDGAEALQVAAAVRPHLVLLDIGLPRMNGYEVASRLRGTPGFERVVLAAITGWGQASDRAQALAAGFDHHLTKPPEPEALQALLASVPEHGAVAATDGPGAPIAVTRATPSPPPGQARDLPRLVHDLRSALNGLILQLLLIQQKGGGQGEIPDLAARALHNGRHLDHLIGQVLRQDTPPA